MVTLYVCVPSLLHACMVCVCIEEEVVSLVLNLHQPHEELTDIKQSHTKAFPPSVYCGESYRNRVLWSRG